MKKLLFELTAVLITAFATTNKVNAQSAASTALLDPKKEVAENFKAAATSAGNENLVGISSKAVKGFAKNYTKSSKESWSIISDGFTARFVLDGMINTVYYDTKGRWSGIRKCYQEDKLSADIRKIVKRVYYDYTINNVVEIETLASNGTPTYLVYVEDKTSTKWLRIFDGEMEEYKVFLK